jgi:hypothetical protein
MVVFLACWILISTVAAWAQQGQNAVYNSSGNPTTSLAFIDASMFVISLTPPNRNLCAVLNFVLANVDQPPNYPSGAIIDARGLANSTPPTSMTCAANTTPWSTDNNVHVLNVPSTILLPATGATPIIIKTPWILPNNTRLVGEGDGVPVASNNPPVYPGTWIQAASLSTSLPAMIQFGPSSAARII